MIYQNHVNESPPSLIGFHAILFCVRWNETGTAIGGEISAPLPLLAAPGAFEGLHHFIS